MFFDVSPTPNPCRSYLLKKSGSKEYREKKVLKDRELGSTKTYERISTDKRSIVNTHSIDISAKFEVGIKENQDRLLTLYWLPKLH